MLRYILIYCGGIDTMIEKHDHLMSSPNQKKKHFSFASKSGKKDAPVLFTISTAKTGLQRKKLSGSNRPTERHCICATS